MADVRELLARLNPAHIKFDTGRGGMPQLTPQDIAAALAFVPKGMGREVLTRLWWPDGARLSRAELDRTISSIVHAEAGHRVAKVHMARTELHIAQEDVLRRNASTARDRAQFASLERRYHDAKAKVWPYDPATHLAVRESVLNEIAHRNLCDTCGGRGALILEQLKISCPTCHAAGVLPMSDRGRATRICRDVSTYRERWKCLYEWLYDQVRDAEQQAAHELARALSRYEVSGAA